MRFLLVFLSIYLSVRVDCVCSSTLSLSAAAAAGLLAGWSFCACNTVCVCGMACWLFPFLSLTHCLSLLAWLGRLVGNCLWQSVCLSVHCWLVGWLVGWRAEREEEEEEEEEEEKEEKDNEL